MKLKDFKQRMLQNPEVKKEYFKYDLAFEVSQMLIEARILNGITQDQLANLINTKQESIARAENGNYLPGLRFLQKIAMALGAQLRIHFHFMNEHEVGYQSLASNSYLNSRKFNNSNYSVNFIH